MNNFCNFSFFHFFTSFQKDEKNDPDVIPHDNSDDEKEFERLYTPTKLNYVNRHSPNTTSPPIRFGEKQVSNKLNEIS